MTPALVERPRGRLVHGLMLFIATLVLLREFLLSWSLIAWRRRERPVDVYRSAAAGAFLPSVHQLAQPITGMVAGAGFAKLLAWMLTADKAASAIRPTICRAIVEAHGGRVWVTCGSATAVHFTLPCAASRAHNAAV